jgi:hypothetical protein
MNTQLQIDYLCEKEIRLMARPKHRTVPSVDHEENRRDNHATFTIDCSVQISEFRDVFDGSVAYNSNSWFLSAHNETDSETDIHIDR